MELESQVEVKEAKQINFEEDKKAYFKHVEEKSREHHEECTRLVSEYKKDGDNVYELFSILNHSGGA